MRFYSYNYLLEQIAKFDWWGAAFPLFLIICLIFNDNRYRQAVHFIEVVAEDLKTDKENIYINTSASIDGALVRIGTLYFRVISGDNGENYLLEKIDLENPKVELIEVNK